MSDYTIDAQDAIGLAAIQLEDALYLLQDITERFFENFDPATKEGALAIAYEYHRYGALARILYSYLHEAQATLQKVKQPHETKLETADK